MNDVSSELEMKSLRRASWWALVLGILIIVAGFRSLREYQSTGMVRIWNTYYLAVGRNAVWTVVGHFASGTILLGYGMYYRVCLRRLRRRG